MLFLRRIVKVLVAIALLALLAVIVTGVSFVYNFRHPQPFSGPDIFNPYRNIDTVHCWKRANFHTHSRVEGILNECEYTAEQTYDKYREFGYDIVTFSNHNQIIPHPAGESLHMNLYEHGYNLFKFHKLVFGSESVNYFDNLLPLFTFQRQTQIDMLSDEADIVVLNHPLRTNATFDTHLQRLSGYNIIELDSGRSTENEYWDTALSAGNYSFALANDDLHYPDRSSAIAVRSNFLCTPTAQYSDIKKALLDGSFYAMRIADYGSGNWDIKREKNRQIPYIKNIGGIDSNIFIALSEKADSIKVTGQNHTTLLLATATDSVGYTMRTDDSYSRFTAYFADGEVIYTNPFARYDASLAPTPFNREPVPVNIPLTALFNFSLLLAAAGVSITLYKTIFVW